MYPALRLWAAGPQRKALADNASCVGRKESVAIGDVYRLTISATGSGSLYQNVIHFKLKLGTGPDAVTFATAASDFLNIYRSAQHPSYSWTDWQAVQQWGSGMVLDTPKCRRLNGRTFAGTITGQVGGGSGDNLPPQAAHVTTLVTGTAGRRKRGRVYGFGQTETNQSDGLWISTYNTAMTGAWNTFSAKYFKDTGTSTELKMGVWSERTATGCIPAEPPARGHVPVDTPDPDNAFTDVIAFTIRPIVYSQRRRTRGVGR